jgi:sulfoxide reductase heme-binding subunit YedZ
MTSIKNLSAKQVGYIKVLVFILGLMPITRIVLAGFLGYLSANPLEFITRNTGDWTLYFLCITFAITPLRRLTKLNWLLRLRRMLGLFGFFYACLHFTTFLWFDHFFDLADMWMDVLERPFITVGFIAFVLLIPLAATSTNAMVRRLGGKRWQWLHNLFYLILPLGILHYWWMKAGKNLLAQPILFATIVSILFLLRVLHKLRAKKAV